MSELKQWMPWATADYSAETPEIWCRKAAASHINRTELAYAIFAKNGEHSGNLSALAINWKVPKCEIGYWLRTSHCGHGYMSEAVQTLVTMLAAAPISMKRIEIRCDVENIRSQKVAERCGFELEGTLRCQVRSADETLRDMRIYSRVFP